MSTFLEMMEDPTKVPDYIQQLWDKGWSVTCILIPGLEYQGTETDPTYLVTIDDVTWEMQFKARTDEDLREAINRWMTTGIMPTEKA